MNHKSTSKNVTKLKPNPIVLRRVQQNPNSISAPNFFRKLEKLGPSFPQEFLLA